MSNTIKSNNGMEVYENGFVQYLDQFLTDNDIDEKEIKPSQWSAALMYIRKHLFADRSYLRMEPYYTGNLINNTKSNNNAYNIDKIDSLCDIYIYQCYLHSMRVSIKEFSLLVGINPDTIYDWRSEDKPRVGLSTSACDIYKKLMGDGENSVLGLLMDKSMNPMKATVILNNQYGYSDKRTIVEHTTGIAAPVSRDQIAQELGIELLPSKA